MDFKKKYSIMAAVVSALVVVIVLSANFLAVRLGQKVNFKFDLTQDKILDFDGQTKEILKNLDTDISVYSLIPEGVEDNIVKSFEEILAKYAKMSARITYQKIDADKNPQFIQKYQQNGERFSLYSVIFEAGDKYRVVDINDAALYNSQTQGFDSLSAESLFTSAIAEVTAATEIRVGVAGGHGEPLTADILERIFGGRSDMTFADADLVNAEIPEKVNVLVVSTPNFDYTPEEIEKIDAYSDRGGNLWVMLDPSDKDYPVLESYLGEWGVKYYPGFLLETQSQNYYQSPALLIPNFVSNDFTQVFTDKNRRFLAPQLRAFTLVEKSGVSPLVLLETSEKAIAKASFSATSAAFEEGDTPGKFTVAAILSRGWEDSASNLAIFGGAQFLNYLNESAFCNKDLALKALSQISGRGSSYVYIKSKDISTPVIAISFNQALIYAILVVILLPLIFLVIGLVVWFKRRHL